MFTLQITAIIFIQQIAIHLLLIYAAPGPDCQQQFQLSHSNHSIWLHPDNNNNSSYSLLEDTKQCDEILQQKLQFNNGNNVVEACTDELLEIDLIPHSVFPVGTNMYLIIIIIINLIIMDGCWLGSLFGHFNLKKLEMS